MVKRDATKGYNTNLAAEFHMMSLLHRAGLNAYLSMGNKKGVDIVLHRDDGDIQVIEVKGVAGKMDWMIGNRGVMPHAPNLYFALVSFNGRISELQVSPDFWLIPSISLSRVGEHAISSNAKTVFLRYKHIRDSYAHYRNSIAALNTDPLST
jgi:hypothetical protein